MEKDFDDSVEEFFQIVDKYYEENPEMRQLMELSKSLRELEYEYKEFLYPNRDKFIFWTDDKTYNDPDYIPDYIKEAYNLK